MAIVVNKELEARRAMLVAAAAAAAAASPTSVSEDVTSPAVTDAAPGSAEDETDDDEPSPNSELRGGYGYPPIKHRFRKDDGRPRGPAKGSRRLKSPQSYLEDELAKLVAVRTGARLKKVPTLHALMMMFVEKAKKGDVRAMRDIFLQASAALPASPEKILDTGTTETDRATLAAFEARIAERISNSTKQGTRQ